MGISERKEREKQEMRRLILDAAMQLFLEDGFEKVSMRRIADKIEYSPATVYLYFQEKNDILYELQKEGFLKFFDFQRPFLQEQDPFERLKKLGEAYIDFALSNPEYYELMFIMKAPMEKCPAEAWEEGNLTFNSLYKTVEQCIAEGKMKPGDPRTASISMWAAVHGLVSLMIRNRLHFLDVTDKREMFFSAMKYLLD